MGGVSLTLYDSTEQGLPKLVVRELRRIIPLDIHEPQIVETPFGKICLRYKFAYFSADADKLTKQVESQLLMRVSSPPAIIEEISLSLHSDSRKPKTILDPPCSLSDIPTVISETVSINRFKKADFSLEAFKYMVTQHMVAPVIEGYDDILVSLVNGLERLREDYDLNPTHLTKYGFLNANYNSRPSSIIRMALAYARANNINTLNRNLSDKIFEEYFKWNFEYVYEVWEDLIKKPSIPISLRAEYRDIIRVIRKYDDGAGVDFKIICSELKKDQYTIDKHLKEMINHGLIYEPAPRRYKIIRDYDTRRMILNFIED